MFQHLTASVDPRKVVMQKQEFSMKQNNKELNQILIRFRYQFGIYLLTVQKSL